MLTPEAFYEISSDPYEQKNLLGLSSVPEDLLRVAYEHLAWARAKGDLGAKEISLPDDHIEELKALGYLQEEPNP